MVEPPKQVIEVTEEPFEIFPNFPEADQEDPEEIKELRLKSERSREGKTPLSPTKVGTITRRKSVMNLGFNQTPTRRESSYSTKVQADGVPEDPNSGGNV